MNARWLVGLVVGACAAVAVAQPPTGPGRRQAPQRNPNLRAPVETDPAKAPPRETSEAPLDLAGSWKGVYCSGLTTVLVDVQLTSDEAKRKVAGEVRYTTVNPPAARARGQEGSWKVAGLVDPGARTVELRVDGPQAVGPIGALEAQGMSGVYCAGRREIAGQMRARFGMKPDAPYFVLVRAEAGARMKTLAEHAAAVMPPARPSGSAPGVEAIAAWAERFTKEYGANAGAQMLARINGVTMPLLNDATFKPVFGEAYDVIEYGKLSAAVQKAAGAGGHVPAILAPSGEKVVSVAAMRVIDAWEGEMVAHLRDDAAVASAFEDLLAVQKAAQERVAYVWPSDKAAMEGMFAQVKVRVAGAALAANAGRAISGASGLEGARVLASWAKDNAAMLGLVGAGEREGAEQKVNAKLDALLEGLLVEPLGQLEKVRTVRDGAAWHRSLVSRFAFAVERPPVKKAVERLAARRGADMAAELEGLKQRVAACTTTEEVDGLFAGDLSVPGDEGAGSYGALAAAGKERKAQIQHDRMMSLFSAQEKEWMDSPGHIDVRKGAGMAPSEESVRLALLRGFAYGTGTMLDAHTARHVIRRTIIPYPVHMSLSGEHLTGFAELEDKTGFVCEYTILTQFAIPPDNLLAGYDEVVRRGIDDQIKAFNVLLQALAGEKGTETFRLYEDGWGVPRLRVDGAAEAVIGALLDRR